MYSQMCIQFENGTRTRRRDIIDKWRSETSRRMLYFIRNITKLC